MPGPDVVADPAASRSGGCRRLTRLVTDTTHGHDDLGVLEVSFDLGSESLDLDVDEPGVDGMPEVPDLFEKHLPAEGLVGSAGKGEEQVELRPGEGDRLVVACDGVPAGVDHEVADSQHVVVDQFG